MIPNIFHFVFGLKPDTFQLYQYIAVASAVAHNAPDVTYVHYAIEPSGEWWQRLKDLPTVVMRKVESPTEVFGNPLSHYAHQSDVVRMQVLLEHGGVYLDIDTITLKDLSPLRQHEFVMGRQGDWGLCNAVMLSRPNSRFLTRWYDEYRYFRGTGHGKPYWDEHSVQLPLRLSQVPEMSDAITVLGPKAFFWPLWNQSRILFSPVMPNMSESWLVHLWETVLVNQLSVITEAWVRSNRCFYATEARKYL